MGDGVNIECSHSQAYIDQCIRDTFSVLKSTKDTGNRYEFRVDTFCKIRCSAGIEYQYVYHLKPLDEETYIQSGPRLIPNAVNIRI